MNITELQEENRRLKEALTPSEATKAAYICEFDVPFPYINEVLSHVNIPWATT